ncbi:MAG: hypothetical protein IPO53_12115 [Chitinophagaceae bacterium]|nr:hypothetical protein [Chitinophagaceae bacterium]
MKKLILATGLVLFVIITKAQPPQPPKPPRIEDRLKKTEELLQKEIQPSAAQQQKLTAAFKIFFIAEDKLRKDNPPPPPPPPDPKVKEAMDKLVKERDESIKKILTDVQYQKYKETAKKLHPPKPGAQNGKNGPPPQTNQ